MKNSRNDSGSEESDDPLIKLLMGKELKFYTLLTSLSTPLHATIEAALSSGRIFNDVSTVSFIFSHQ